MTPFNPQNTGRHTVTFCDKFQMSHKETEIATTIIRIIRRSIIKKYYYNNSPNTKQLLIFNLDLCVCYFAMIMFPQMHVDIAVRNILLTFSMTLTETDRLRAEQTSAAVSHSALPLKLFLFNLYFELCPSHHKMQTLLDIKEKIQSNTWTWTHYFIILLNLIFRNICLRYNMGVKPPNTLTLKQLGMICIPPTTRRC